MSCVHPSLCYLGEIDYMEKLQDRGSRAVVP